MMSWMNTSAADRMGWAGTSPTVVVRKEVVVDKTLAADASRSAKAAENCALQLEKRNAEIERQKGLRASEHQRHLGLRASEKSRLQATIDSLKARIAGR